MKIGSLCTGYGGLDMALRGETVWVSDIDKHARALLAHRFPDVSNLGDLTTIDWTHVEPVDIITAGYPCQPFSHAGKREGTNDERHIWPHIANALRILRPRYAFFENVAGHVSLGLADVLADLAEIGFDAEWTTVRASDVGAPHRRERLFILACDAHNDGRLSATQPRGVAEDERPRRAHGQTLNGQPARGCGAPTTDAPCDPRRILNGDGLSPTDADQPGREGAEPAQRSDVSTWGDYGPAGPPADTEINEQREPTDRGQVRAEPWDGTWGDYQPAITQWEHVTGRAAPAPTTTGTTGRAVLNPPFVEWMMGLPAGWVTDVPGISRTGQLHLLGNGVVPQQARAALAILADQAVAA